MTMQLETIVLQWPNILEDPHPTFAKLLVFTNQLREVVIETLESIREYTIKAEKICYFTPRRVRQSTLSIANYVNQILTKCVMYKDSSNSKC